MRISDWSSDVCFRSAKATPGPYRAHDHNNMGEPDEWIGYAWVGRITKDSTPDGLWDARWADMDRRKDAAKEYSERRSEARRAGQEGVSTGRDRWSPYH